MSELVDMQSNAHDVDAKLSKLDRTFSDGSYAKLMV